MPCGVTPKINKIKQKKQPKFLSKADQAPRVWLSLLISLHSWYQAGPCHAPLLCQALSPGPGHSMMCTLLRPCPGYFLCWERPSHPASSSVTISPYLLRFFCKRWSPCPLSPALGTFHHPEHLPSYALTIRLYKVTPSTITASLPSFFCCCFSFTLRCQS